MTKSTQYTGDVLPMHAPMPDGLKPCIDYENPLKIISALLGERQGHARAKEFANRDMPLFGEVPHDALRWCSSCSSNRGWLHKTAFSLDGTVSSGVRRYCKVCEAAKAKKRRKEKDERKWYNGLRRTGKLPNSA